MITLALNNYIVKLYGNNLDSIDTNSMQLLLNNQEYPRGIVEQLENNDQINSIEIYSLDNELLLVNNKSIE